MPGMGELIVILLIVLVVFGANKLPGIGDALGRSIKNFKKASSGEDEQQLLVGVVDVQREARRAGRQLEEGGAEIAAARLPAQARAAPAVGRGVSLLVEVRVVDVGHAPERREGPGRQRMSTDTCSVPVGKVVPVSPKERYTRPP